MLEGKPYKQNVSDRLRQRLGVKVSLFFFTTLRVVSYFCRDALAFFDRFMAQPPDDGAACSTLGTATEP
jgi:hypothetical protein